MTGFAYPQARRCGQIDEYQSQALGTVVVADPYRWLENPSDAETVEFVDAQNNSFQQYIQRCSGRENMRKVVADVTSVPQLGCPHRVGDDFYYTHRVHTPQPIMYRKSASDRSPDLGTVFMDMSKLSERGTSAVQTVAFSKTGAFFAYGVSEGGSDWLTIYVKALAPTELAMQPEPAFGDGVRLADKVEDVKWSTTQWSDTEHGFYYHRFPRTEGAGSPDRDSAIYFHRVGTEQAKDSLIHQDPQTPFMQYVHEVSDDGKWLVITETLHGALTDFVTLMAIANDQVGEKMVVRASGDEDSNLRFIGNLRDVFYFSSTWGAPRGRVMAYDMAQGRWREHLAEDGTLLLRAAYAYSDSFLLVVYMRDVKDELWVFDLRTGKTVGRVGEEIVGSVQVKQTVGRRTKGDLFLKVTSFLAPDTVYGVCGNQIHLHGRTRAVSIDPSQFVTRQEFFTSKDGTRVPMFLTHAVEYTQGGPVLLYGYGGFNVSVVPVYNPAFVSFLKGFGGVVACVNLRGGGEYGEEWHRAGMLGRKQNAFDDFHHAALHLVRKGITTHDHIVAMGGSNGGLLVGACLNQRPELYGCALAKVAVLDCLRYTTSAAGSLGISEIGDPCDPAAFDYLYAYSPLHNVRPGAEAEAGTDAPYPPVLLFTADRDNRVPPMHSLKQVAELQHLRPDNPNPMMLRVDTQAGHGAGKSLDKTIEELCDQWAFVSLAIGLSWDSGMTRFQ